MAASLALAGAALSQAPAQAAAATLTEVSSPRIIQRASAATWTFTTNPSGAAGQVTLTLTPLTVPGETLAATVRTGSRSVTVAANTLQPGYYDVTAAFPEADTWTGSLVVVDGTVAQEARMGMDTQMSWDAIDCSTALGCRDTKDETIKWEGPNMPARTQWAIELMQLMGIGSVRDRQEWTCGSWVRPAARYMSQFLHGAGFNVDVNTAWSANCEDGSVPNFDRVPLDYDTVYQWGYEFATQHGANVNSVEYGNESVGATSHGGWPFQYASGLKAFSAGVKSVNPNIKILTAAGLSDYWRWDWSLLFEQEALANGTANDFDVRNMHVYPSGLATIADAPYGYSATASYTQLDQAAGIGGKGVWLTETGYNLKSQPMAIAEVEQAAYMIEAYTLGFASGFERIYPYILHSADDCGSNVGCHNSYGLTRNALDSEWLDGLTQDMSPRPAIASIAALSRLIQGRAVEQVERTSTGATVYFAGNVAVTWDSSRPLSAYGNVSAKNMYG
ncbi:MAG: hypothetical protein LBR19_01165, partial [Bifidobacteriaceae bacterium]|nr:hypothetical protein [Bifidobacteriaceae bacterium]